MAASVKLTDEQIVAIINGPWGDSVAQDTFAFARAIEAAVLAANPQNAEDVIRPDVADVLARLEEMAGYKYQYHTIHAPALMLSAAALIRELQAEREELTRSRNGWTDDAHRLAKDSAYWRVRAERAEAERDERDRMIANLKEGIATLTEASVKIVSERDAAIKAIREHNDGLQAACDARRGPHGCDSYIKRGRACPDCPREWVIDAAIYDQPAADVAQLSRDTQAATPAGAVEQPRQRKVGGSIPPVAADHSRKKD